MGFTKRKLASGRGLIVVPCPKCYTPLSSTERKNEVECSRCGTRYKVSTVGGAPISILKKYIEEQKTV